MEAYKIVISTDYGESGGTVVTNCKIRRMLGPMTYVVYVKDMKKCFICTIDQGKEGSSSVSIQDKYDREISSFDKITVTMEDVKEGYAK